MKRLIVLALTASALLAQPQDTEKMYQEMRTQGIEMTAKVIPALKEMKACIVKAPTKEAAQTCAAIMEKALGATTEPVVGDDKVWDDMTKKKVVFDIDVAIHESTEAGKCFNVNEKFSDFQECIKKAEIM